MAVSIMKPRASNMTELMQKVTQAEAARFATEQDGARRVREAEATVNDATEILADARRQHVQKVSRINTYYEKRARDALYLVRKDQREAEEARRFAEGTALRMEEEQKGAENKVHVLEAKVAKLQAELHAKIQKTERRTSLAQYENEERVRRIVQQCSERIESMKEHTEKVEETAQLAMETVQSEHEYQMNLAHLRAEGRERFKELCDLSGKSGRKEITHDVYDMAKEDILGVWRRQTLCAPGCLSQVEEEVDIEADTFTDVELSNIPADPPKGRASVRPRSQLSTAPTTPSPFPRPSSQAIYY